MASDPTRNLLRRRSLRRLRGDDALQAGEIARLGSAGWPRVLSFADRLSVGALGLSLAIIVSVAWGSAVFYLASRLGVDPRIRLSAIDAVHVYVGLVGGAFVAAKVLRVRFRYRVRGVPEVVVWQRWLSWSMLVLYSGVWLSGVVLLLPIHGFVYNDLINFHLLTSFWALVPTTWHVWHYRRRAFPFLTRILPQGRTAAYWGGVALALLPSIFVVANARSLSQLPQVLGGSSWSQVALQGSYLDRISLLPDGTILAAGDALYVSRDGIVWTQIDIPAASGSSSGGPVHQHGAPSGKNLALALASADGTIYVGADSGMYATRSLTGPLQPLGFDGKTVQALAVDPSNPAVLWAGTTEGLTRSSDGGVSWTTRGTGLARPASVAALAFMAGRFYASDTTGVYEWNEATSAWQAISSEPSVVDLAPDGDRLYATSSTQGVEYLASGTWHTTASLASPHQHHTGNEVHPEVLSVVVVQGRVYAVGTAFGVSASADDGQTWSQLGVGIGDATAAQAVDFNGAILAATSSGLYRLPLSPYSPASATWWLAVLIAAAVCGAGGVLLVGAGTLRALQKVAHK